MLKKANNTKEHRSSKAIHGVSTMIRLLTLPFRIVAAMLLTIAFFAFVVIYEEELNNTEKKLD